MRVYRLVPKAQVFHFKVWDLGWTRIWVEVRGWGKRNDGKWSSRNRDEGAEKHLVC